MLRWCAVLLFCILTQACKSTRKSQSAEDTSVGLEENFRDDHTVYLMGDGVSPPALSGQREKALAYARLDARLDAESKFGDICYGVSIRPCEPKRRVEPRVAEALKKNLRQIREKCIQPTPDKPMSCRIDFEFRYEGIRRFCESARAEDSMKILTAGCGAW